MKDQETGTKKEEMIPLPKQEKKGSPPEKAPKEESGAKKEAFPIKVTEPESGAKKDETLVEKPSSAPGDSKGQEVIKAVPSSASAKETLSAGEKPGATEKQTPSTKAKLAGGNPTEPKVSPFSIGNSKWHSFCVGE